MKVILILLVFMCSVGTLQAQSPLADSEEEVTHLDKKGFESVLQSIKPSIDEQNQLVVLKWEKDGDGAKQAECSDRRQRCVDIALKGGHTNAVAEAGRLYFCKTSREICAEFWN